MIALVSVGLASVSSIELSRQQGDPVRKGDEIGNFSYGGSVIVMVFESGRLQDLIGHGRDTPYPTRQVIVMMGQRIGTLVLDT